MKKNFFGKALKKIKKISLKMNFFKNNNLTFYD